MIKFVHVSNPRQRIDVASQADATIYHLAPVMRWVADETTGRLTAGWSLAEKRPFANLSLASATVGRI